MSFDKRLSSCCAYISSQHFESGRLSCTIDSQQPKALSRTDAQTQAVHRQDAPHLTRLIHLQMDIYTDKHGIMVDYYIVYLSELSLYQEVTVSPS